MLIDSNIIIYAAKPKHPELRSFIATHTPTVSAVSYVEVLGCHKLSEQEQKYFEDFFAASFVSAISGDLSTRAVELRQLRKMTLGDALIAGTALAHRLTLVTRNTKDFEWIDNLTLLNPFSANKSTE